MSSIYNEKDRLKRNREIQKREEENEGMIDFIFVEIFFQFQNIFI